MKVLVTGSAGFIGFHLALRLLEQGHEVTGFDGITDYYDPALKRDRLAILERHDDFRRVDAMLEEARALDEAVAAGAPELVFHLAAQAGVRYSLEAPGSYVQSNVVGTANLLEVLRRRPVRHLVFASTSSIYGGNTQLPFAETDRADGPVSLYGATKKAGEAMVHSYAHLFGIAATCVRFFTVYGPWGRPDMAAFRFARGISRGEAIDVYGQGKMRRDFTYVDDLVEALVRLGGTPPVMGQPVGAGDSLSAVAPFRIVNAGGGQPVELMDFIGALERAFGRAAQVNLLPMQPGDVVATEADTGLLQALVGTLTTTLLDEGVARFASWYGSRYGG